MTDKNMKTIKNVAVTIILVASALNPTYSQTTSKSDDIIREARIEIDSMNSKIENLFIKKDVNALLVGLYSKELTFFAEYKPSITEIGILKNFYSDWFKVVDVKSYKKETYKVELFSACGRCFHRPQSHQINHERASFKK